MKPKYSVALLLFYVSIFSPTALKEGAHAESRLLVPAPTANAVSPGSLDSNTQVNGGSELPVIASVPDRKATPHRKLFFGLIGSALNLGTTGVGLFQGRRDKKRMKNEEEEARREEERQAAEDRKREAEERAQAKADREREEAEEAARAAEEKQKSEAEEEEKLKSEEDEKIAAAVQAALAAQDNPGA